MTTSTSYIVTAAPGYYGDTTRVLSAHRTLAAARRAAGRTGRYVVRQSTLARGETLYRAAEHTAPIVAH